MSLKEKKAFKNGFFAGLNKAKTKGNASVSKTLKSKQTIKPVFMGESYVNGKFYDTNCKKPILINKSEIRNLHKEYDFDGKQTDKDVVNSFVKHMRRKFGSFDEKGKFVGMLGDK